ncbi:MAG: hypothetical protein VX641_06205 [Planctomycetota bacterium]|nr:hypothetical protein [Planctomycetota bacterium]
MPTYLRLHLGLCLAGLVLGACSGNNRNPASTNIQYGPQDEFANRVLSPSGANEVITILQESVNGPADDPARPAKYGVRWDDVRLAAVRAGGQLELAIVSITELDDGDTKHIRMISIGDTPVELFVHRKPPPTIYAASARAGLFDDDHALASSLVSQFEESMRLYGAKPSWPPLKND